MAIDPDERRSVPLADAVGRVGPALLAVLEEFERSVRYLDPSDPQSLRASLGPLVGRLQVASALLAAAETTEPARAFADRLAEGARHAERAGRGLIGDTPHTGGPVAAYLAALRDHCLAQESLFPLRPVLPRLDAYFIEPGFDERLPGLAAAGRREEPTGLFVASNSRTQRGGFTLFVSEDYEPSRAWPLVVALHGAFGHGADFLWSWLREARARGWLLLAPTSRDTTWSLASPDVDGRALDAMLEYVRDRFRIDEDRVLLTGLSDGATFTLLHGLRDGSPFTHLAPMSGVLHPANEVIGNLARARGRRIRLVHGARDWMFPVTLAREAVRILDRAGARIDYDEVPDLGHAHPRERNGGILAWATGATPDPTSGDVE